MNWAREREKSCTFKGVLNCHVLRDTPHRRHQHHHHRQTDTQAALFVKLLCDCLLGLGRFIRWRNKDRLLFFLFRCVWSCNMSGFVDRNSRGGGKCFQSHQWGQSYTINITCDSYTWFCCYPALGRARSAHQRFILCVKLFSFSFKGLQDEHSKKTTKRRNTALDILSQTNCLVMYKVVERRMKRKNKNKTEFATIFSSCCSHGKKQSNRGRVSDHITCQALWREIVEEQRSQRRLCQNGMSEITKWDERAVGGVVGLHENGVRTAQRM